MEKTELLYEGKAKKVYATDDPELVIVSYKDDATALDGLKKGTVAGKGVVNNKMSNFLCRLLESRSVQGRARKGAVRATVHNREQ